MALLVKSKCLNGDFELKFTLGTVFFSNELVDPRGVALDKLPPTAGLGNELPIEPRIGCCWTRPWVALNSFGSGEMAGRWLHQVCAAVT